MQRFSYSQQQIPQYCVNCPYQMYRPTSLFDPPPRPYTFCYNPLQINQPGILYCCNNPQCLINQRTTQPISTIGMPQNSNHMQIQVKIEDTDEGAQCPRSDYAELARVEERSDAKAELARVEERSDAKQDCQMSDVYLSKEFKQLPIKKRQKNIETCRRITAPSKSNAFKNILRQMIAYAVQNSPIYKKYLPTELEQYAEMLFIATIKHMHSNKKKIGSLEDLRRFWSIEKIESLTSVSPNQNEHEQLVKILQKIIRILMYKYLREQCLSKILTSDRIYKTNFMIHLNKRNEIMDYLTNRDTQ